MLITVICADGRVRHPAPFGSLGEAQTWANWGHCCLATHTYRREEASDGDARGNRPAGT